MDNIERQLTNQSIKMLCRYNKFIEKLIETKCSDRVMQYRNWKQVGSVRTVKKDYATVTYLIGSGVTLARDI